MTVHARMALMQGFDAGRMLTRHYTLHLAIDVHDNLVS